MTHRAFASGNVAIITGGASGIGFAAAKRFVGMGLKVCIADLPGDGLHQAVTQISPRDAMAVPCDVGKPEDLHRLETAVRDRFGRVDILMNNAGIQPGTKLFDPDNWPRTLDVNLWGVIRGTQALAPGMIAQGTPGLIINTGSKQGITTPPGDPAYNISKAGVKVFTEALQHQLRNTEHCKITAHLLIPGFVFTSLTAHGRTEKPAGAWTADQTAAFMIERIAEGDFYILCPDNEVTRQLDEKRIAWAAGDIIENRPPLSRWHPDWTEIFTASLAKELPKSR